MRSRRQHRAQVGAPGDVVVVERPALSEPAGLPVPVTWPGAAVLALGAILLLAAAVRAVGVRYGLPYPLLNPDEAALVPRAFAMAHEWRLDPGWYDYPSLMLGLLAPAQALVAEPSYGAARVLAVLLGVGGVAGTWWLGKRAYGTAAALVGAAAVAVSTLHVAYSRAAVTDVLLTLLLTCSLALALEGRLEWAGAALGLATSAKYPGLLAAPALIVAGWGSWRRLARAGGLALAAFALTSPFVLVHARSAWGDLVRVQGHARRGWIGFEHDPLAPLAFLERLWQGLGPLLVLSLVAILVAVRRRRRADRVLLAFAGVYWLSLMPLHAHFDRYVLPLVPVLAVLAGSVRRLVPLALALLLVPATWSVQEAVRLTRTDTRVRAASWIETHVPRRDRIAVDPSTLTLDGRRVVALGLPGPGRRFDRRRSLAVLERARVRWVLVSGALTDRVLAARERYPHDAAFYDSLRRRARVAFAVSPREPGLTGPWVRVYRL